MSSPFITDSITRFATFTLTATTSSFIVKGVFPSLNLWVAAGLLDNSFKGVFPSLLVAENGEVAVHARLSLLPSIVVPNTAEGAGSPEYG